MMNILIVESENDEFFIRALVDNLKQTNTNVCSITDFKYSPYDDRGKKLTTQITSILSDVTIRPVAKIGVILDLDAAKIEERLEIVNNSFKNAFHDTFDSFPTRLLSDINELVTIPIDDNISIQFACYFTNIDGSGELETVLKAIKKYDSTFSDCLLTAWIPCITSQGKKISEKGEQGDINEKDIVKLWVDFYRRFDTLKRKDRNESNTDWKGIWLGETQANKKGETKQVKRRGEEIFDLESEILDDLKHFLRFFN